jgi:hypothetical protein
LQYTAGVVQVYPNPTSNNQVSLTTKKDGELLIMNALGKQFNKIQVFADVTNVIELPSSGLWILQLNTIEGKKINLKVLAQP